MRALIPRVCIQRFRCYSTAPLREKVRLVEVGPRDGLQNEKATLSVDLKAELIARLASVGLRNIEAGSFVSPKWVPQLADSAKVLESNHVRMAVDAFGPTLSLPVLVPNLTGWEAFRAVLEASDSKGQERASSEIAVFVAATESFSKRNTNGSIAEVLERTKAVTQRALDFGIRVRGYVSCVVGCPIEGSVGPEQVSSLAEQLLNMGCYEVSLGDTNGVATPISIETLLDRVLRRCPAEAIAMHCHDTFGCAVANVLQSVRMGIRTIDSAVAGLGGCPYSPGATGNVATEDVVYALELEGYSTGLADNSMHPLSISSCEALEPLAEVGDWISAKLNRPNASSVGRAVLARRAARESKVSAKL